MTKEILYAGLGGFLGTVVRSFLTLAIPMPSKFIITFCINITGSFLLGCLAGISTDSTSFLHHPNWKAFMTLGICGGFTTFSTFSMENIRLMQEGKFLTSFLYIAASLVVGLMATYGGYKLTS